MRADQQIQINTLLLQREELFVRIHDLEKSAAALLGEPYPFTRPALPSDPRNKRKSSSARATVRDPLRKLEGLETCYRVTYQRFGQIVTEDHDELEALRTLLAAQGKNLSITRLETIDLGGRTKAVLIASVAPAAH
jgi:hypothetical protein